MRKNEEDLNPTELRRIKRRKHIALKRSVNKANLSEEKDQVKEDVSDSKKHFLTEKESKRPKTSKKEKIWATIVVSIVFLGVVLLIAAGIFGFTLIKDKPQFD